MKAKKMSLVATVTVVAVLGFLALNAWAGDYTCTVVQAGPSSSSNKVFIMLTDDGGDFTNRWFRVPADRENQYLATALTAIASNLKVVVNTSGYNYAWLNTIYIK